VSPELSRYQIRSPANGEILEIASDSSRSIAAGSPVMTIGNPRDLEVVVDLLSTDAVQVTPGAPATIDGWGRDAVLDATVRSIEPIGFTKVSALGIEEQRVRVHLDITTPKEEWQSLGHLYRVFVRIETQRIEDAYLVPTAALFRDNDEWAMFTVDGDTAHLRPVKLGPRNANTAALDETIAEGTPVILHPNDRIEEGSLVADRAAAE
jgi:HlyD family secretion protein